MFYQRANTVVVLDNTLAEILRIDFNSIAEFRNISQVTTATDRRLWLFNSDTQQLELFDYNMLAVISNYQSIQELPSIQTSNFNSCYLANETELYHYNSYGALLNKIAIPSFEMLKQYDDKLIGLSDQNLYYKSSKETTFKPIAIDKNNIQNFYLLDEILYIYDGQQITTGILKPTKN